MFGTPLTVILASAAYIPAHNDGCGTFPKKKLDTHALEQTLNSRHYKKPNSLLKEMFAIYCEDQTNTLIHGVNAFDFSTKQSVTQRPLDYLPSCV